MQQRDRSGPVMNYIVTRSFSTRYLQEEGWASAKRVCHGTSKADSTWSGSRSRNT